MVGVNGLERTAMIRRFGRFNSVDQCLVNVVNGDTSDLRRALPVRPDSTATGR
jgi:hypothetical protein